MDDLDRLALDLIQGANRALDEAEVVARKTILDVEATSKAIVPVDTGYLRSSIGHEVHRGHDYVEAQAGPTADYGEHVETGTATQAPQAYMGPSFDRHSGTFVSGIEQIGERLL